VERARIAILVVLGLVLGAGPARAQAPTAITSSGLGTTVTPVAGGTHEITGGTRPAGGPNLFHSFGRFSVGVGDTAQFKNTTPNLVTRNILSRVTGGEVSSIYGTIDSSTYLGANLFLINPAGVIFGPSATLNVGGSFHVSSADYIRFVDGSTFCVSMCPNQQANTLSVADPASFGFLGPRGPITVEGSFLQVPADQTLGIVGGAVTISGGAFLLAPSGRLRVASVTGGEVSIATLEGATASLGQVGISGGSSLDASGDPPGSVVIRGGQLTIDGAFISAHTFGELNGTSAIGIDLGATQQLVITNSSTVGTETFAGGRGGDIRLAAPVVEISGTSSVTTATSGAGRGGDIDVTADTLRVTGGASINSVTQFGGGQGGDIRITAGRPADGVIGSIEISDGAVVSTLSLLGDNALLGTGGGALTITAPGGTVTLAAGGALESVNLGLTGPGGNVGISADTITISGRDALGSPSRVASSTVFAGDGGGLSLSAQTVTVGAGGTVVSQTSGDGRAGDVSVTAGSFNLMGGSSIGSHNASSALPGGNVTVTVTGPVLISGADGGTSPTGIFTSSSGTTPLGDPTPAGRITLDVGSLDLRSQAVIQSGDVTAQGGGITITAHGAVNISDRAGISSQTFLQDVGSVTLSAPTVVIDGGFINTSTLEAGRAGSIVLNVGTLLLSGGGQVASSSVLLASGSAGHIDVTASESITITGASSNGRSVLPVPFGDFVNDARSGIFSTAAATGPGGNITLRAPQFRLADGGTISASSTGGPTATAGSIDITFGDQFVMDHASISTDSTLADGGNISITSTGSLLHMIDSQITTSVRSGLGGGGNITLGSTGHPLDFIVLDNSGIHADAFGGPGGNISIFVNVMLSSTPIETAITASSALSSPGTVNINAVITDVSGSLAELSTEVLGAAALLRASCAARLAEGKTSSLVVAGREGLPLEPGGLLPSALRELHAAGVAGSASPFFASEWPGLRRSYLDAACGR
jgi:filamentous hemagglutinin family protein